LILQDDPLNKTGHVAGNSTNMSATSYADHRRVAPTGGGNADVNSARHRSGRGIPSENGDDEIDSDHDGDFQ
jgi:hypothetical protein